MNFLSGITYLQNAKDGKNRQNVPSFMINSDLQNMFTGLLNNGLRVLFKRHFDHEYSIKIGQLSIFTSSSEWKTGVALVTWQRLAQIKNVGQPSVLLNPHQLCQCCTVAALRLNAS